MVTREISRRSIKNAAVKWTKPDAGTHHAVLGDKEVQVSRYEDRKWGRVEYTFHGTVFAAGTSTSLAKVGPFDNPADAKEAVLLAAGVVAKPRAERTSTTIEGLKWERLANSETYVAQDNGIALKISKQAGGREPVTSAHSRVAYGYRNVPAYWAAEAGGRRVAGRHPTMKSAAEAARRAVL